MKTKDLKINFRYLGGNIACLSVDSIDGESVHNDINNEEAIIIFNSLVGEKENCQTVKTLLKENQELKEKLDKYENPEDMTLMMMWCTEKVKDENLELKKQLENCYCNRTDCSGRIKDSKVYDSLVQKVETQQKAFINYLESWKENEEYCYLASNPIDRCRKDIYEEVLQKYKSIIGDDK